MGTIRLLVLRARARIGLLLSIGAIVAVSTFSLAMIVGGLATATADGVASALSSTGTDATALVVTAAPAQPGDAQQVAEAVESIIADTIPDGEVARSTTASGALAWTIQATARTPGGATRLGSGIADLVALVATNPVENARIDVTGGLPATISALERGMLALSSITPVPVLVVLVFSAIALGQLGRLLAAARAGETELARARGLTRGQLAGLAAAEGALVAAPGLLLGLGLAIGVLLLVQGAHPTIADGWAVAAAAAAIAPVVLAADAWIRASHPSATRAERSGRGVGATATGAVLATIAAGVAVSQLLRSGSPLVPDGDDGVRIDAIAETAPVLVLLAGALIALLAFRPIAVLVQGIAARRPSLSGALAARQVARRVTLFQVPLLLVALSIATAALTAGYAASWTSLATASAEQQNGASVRARLADGSPAAAITARLRTEDGVSSAAPAVAAPIHVGSDGGAITALPAAGIPAVMRDAGGTVDTTAMRTALDGPAPGAVLPANASALRATVTITATDAEPRGVVTVSAWLADAVGALVPVPLGQAPVQNDGALTLTAELPDGTAPWRLLALDGELGAADGATGVVLTVDAWGADAASSAIDVPAEASATLSSTEPLGRVMATDASGTAIAAVITQALASRLGVGIGDHIDYQFDGVPRSGSVVVRGTTPSIPGSDAPLGFVVSLPALNEALLRTNGSAEPTNEVWLSTTPGVDRGAVADRVSGALGADATVTVAEPGIATALAAPGVTAMWLGVAAAIALAVVAMAAVTIALVAARAGETALLRAVGVTARAQAGGRVIELGVVGAAGALLGLVIGAAAVLLTAMPFARASVADGAVAVSLPPSVDLPALLLATGLIVVALAVIIGAYAARVRRQAAGAILGGSS